MTSPNPPESLRSILNPHPSLKRLHTGPLKDGKPSHDDSDISTLAWRGTSREPHFQHSKALASRMKAARWLGVHRNDTVPRNDQQQVFINPEQAPSTVPATLPIPATDTQMPRQSSGDLYTLFSRPFFSSSEFKGFTSSQAKYESDRDQDNQPSGRPAFRRSARVAKDTLIRPRLEGGPNGQGQGQGTLRQPNPQGRLMHNGIGPRAMTPVWFPAFQQSGPDERPKSIQVYARNLALHHSRSTLNNLEFPGLMSFSDGQRVAQARAGMQTPDSQPDNQDYEMQLMLFEQQKKRRLMLAQEQNGMATSGEGQPAIPRRGSPNMPQTGQPNDYQMQLMLLEQENKQRLMLARQEQDGMATRAEGQPAIPRRGSPKMPQTGQPDLQDYQMQRMLLEQENKRRLMLARQEQDGMATRADGQPAISRRGSPKMPQTGLPGSTSTADTIAKSRGSPTSKFTFLMKPTISEDLSYGEDVDRIEKLRGIERRFKRRHLWEDRRSQIPN